MRAEDLDKLNEEQLQQRANGCFIQAENTSVDLSGGGYERLRLQLEAQFYMTALARKRDEGAARRDFRLEIWVIVLISLEIVLSLLFGFWGLYEGYQQSQVLDHMEVSTAATAAAMTAAKGSLKTLADQQATSLDHLKQMNDSLQASLRQTGTMATNTQRQLKIFEEEAANEQPGRPQDRGLYFWVEGVPLTGGDPMPFLGYRQASSTRIEFKLTVQNKGNRRVEDVTIQVYAAGGLAGPNSAPLSAPQVDLGCECSWDLRGRSIVLHLERVEQGEIVEFKLSASYPQEYGSFAINFNVFGKNIVQTHLGGFHRLVDIE